MTRTQLLCLCSTALLCAASCSQDAYDTSRGIDKEIRLFTEQVSLPVGDVGPFTPSLLLDKAGLGNVLKSFVKEDQDGFLVIEKEGLLYSNPVLLIAYTIPDQTKPVDLPVSDQSGNLGSDALSLSAIGFAPSLQAFSIQARNPLSDEISISGKLTITSAPDGSSPAETLASQEFSKAKVSAGNTVGEILRVERTGGKSFYEFQLENLIMHLPANLLEKDTAGGLGFLELGYHYKAYISLEKDLAESIPFVLSDLNLPLGQFQVKEARICTEVSSEIPVTLAVESVEVLVKQSDENGKESVVTCGDVSVSPGIRIESGSSGNPAITPLDITIKANEGTVPDISGLQLSLSIKAPTGSGDKRLGMNQAVYFNNLRATVSGGITIQGL